MGRNSFWNKIVKAFTPPCHGNHPGEIRFIKDRIHEKCNELGNGANTVQDRINKYTAIKNKLNDDIRKIKYWYTVQIPNRKRKNAEAKEQQIGIKNAERTRVIARRNTAMANLNNTLAELEKCKNDYVEKQKTTERTGKYISETTRDNIALNNVVEDTYKQIYNAIIIENGVLTTKQTEISKMTETDNSKMENQIKQTNSINNIRVILFCFYYILVAFVISLFVYKNINIYSKVLFILILIAYPLFIYNVQYFLHTLWNSTYAYLRISVPENK